MLWALLAALVLAGAARADFRDMRMGARPRAMGSAFVSLCDDANAAVWNPAGLVRDTRLSAMISRSWLYAAGEVRNDDLILDLPAWRGIHLGAGFVRLGITDVYYEDTYTLGAGVLVPWVEHLSVGAALKVFRLSAPGYEQYGDPAFVGDDTGFAYDLGFHYDGGRWTLGGTLNSLNEPHLQLLSTTTNPDPVYSHFAVGGSYVFRDILLISGDLRSREGGWGNTAVHGGAEIWFFDALALRSGLAAGRITMGIGLQDVHWQTDISLESHEDLGNVYMLSFTVRN
jgi:hypothetical protein